MTTRISGLASGLDTDSIIKETMKPYQTKVDQKKQERDVTQYQQDQYRELVKASQDFYNKYFDITKSDSLLRDGSYKTVSFSAGDGSDTATNSAPVTAKGLAGAAVDNYKVEVQALAQPAKQTITPAQLSAMKALEVKINGQDVTVVRGTQNDTDFISSINSKFNSLGMRLTQSAFNGGNYTLSTNNTGESAKFDLITTTAGTNTTTVDAKGNTIIDTSQAGATTTAGIQGTKASVKITNSAGQTVDYNGDSNTTVIDNVQFNFNGVTGAFGNTTDINGNHVPSATAVNLTGRTDVKDLKDKIVGFINDYNTLLGKINTKIYETRDKNYMPLTDDQKASMSDSQIQKWETKAQTGLLRRDSDLQRIADNMKSAMGATQSLLQSSGLSLEKIGIKPVQNYQDKNGLYTVDEEKLTTALQTNGDQIKTMFTKLPSSDTAEDGGILQKLKKVLNDETISSDSPLSKKAGFEGTATFYDNELTRQLAEEKKKIDEMTADLTDRENKLYSKYSKLESAMNSLNSQQSWFSQQMGQ
ncbi:flagellar filament capping protein FliD [Inconstantimicrobium mannanitabidum]|uniref:Flagellar hook-associated protein 2 n=1 Tax=Inconstantimicrobium mannanitabidum TaxID=1604901 RepID=A0ACB5R8V3_9CLOT|nr:flagellar filament capping protein FliD [Clostridium sp. TW13]GKX65466.1 flagellar hook-associated protein 2 [Clostridium sp. TW13]